MAGPSSEMEELNQSSSSMVLDEAQAHVKTLEYACLGTEAHGEALKKLLELASAHTNAATRAAQAEAAKKPKEPEVDEEAAREAMELVRKLQRLANMDMTSRKQRFEEFEAIRARPEGLKALQTASVLSSFVNAVRTPELDAEPVVWLLASFTRLIEGDAKVRKTA